MFNILRNLSYLSVASPKKNTERHSQTSRGNKGYKEIILPIIFPFHCYRTASHYKELFKMTFGNVIWTGRISTFGVEVFIRWEAKVKFRRNLRLMLLIIYDDDCFKSILKAIKKFLFRSIKATENLTSKLHFNVHLQFGFSSWATFRLSQFACAHSLAIARPDMACCFSSEKSNYMWMCNYQLLAFWKTKNDKITTYSWSLLCLSPSLTHSPPPSSPLKQKKKPERKLNIFGGVRLRGPVRWCKSCSVIALNVSELN
jgi:hypothetical protein